MQNHANPVSAESRIPWRREGCKPEQPRRGQEHGSGTLDRTKSHAGAIGLTKYESQKHKAHASQAQGKCQGPMQPRSLSFWTGKYYTRFDEV
jgi:hypothetical protein